MNPQPVTLDQLARLYQARNGANSRMSAALVAAAECEACLEIADQCADADMHASMAANAIRARSQE